MRKHFYLLILLATMLLPVVSQAQFADYFCDFENDSDTAGWTFVDAGQANRWCIGTGAHNSGSRGMYIYSSDTSVCSYVNTVTAISYAYRSFELEAGHYYFSYDWKGYGESSYDYLRAFLVPNSVAITPGYLPNGTTSTSGFINTVPAGWIALDGGGKLNLSNSWQTRGQEVEITAEGTYNLIFMWCNDASSGTVPPASIDNVSVGVVFCPTPRLPIVANLDTTSFDLYWTNNSDGNAYGWMVEVDTVGQLRGTGLTFTVFDTFCPVSGLTPNTEYQVYLNSLCGSSDTSDVAMMSVRTLCVDFTSLPFVEGFESAPTGGATSDNFANCWTRLNDAATYFGYPYVTSSYPHSGNKGLYWYNSDATGYGTYQCIVLPGFDQDSIHLQDLQLGFWAKTTSSSYRPVIEVGVMSDPLDVSTFVNIQTINVSSTEWQEFFVNFPSAPDTTRFIALRANASTGNWYACLDDFTLRLAPACPGIASLEASHVGSSGAELTWAPQTGFAHVPTSYDVIVDLVGSATHVLQTTSVESRYIVTGLAPNSDYKAFVRPTCVYDSESLGEWDSITFSTNSLPCIQYDYNLSDTVEIGTGATGTTIYYLPVSNFYNYTYSQQLVLASEMNGPASLTGIDFQYAYNTASTQKTNCTIYMANTTVASLSSAFVPYSSDFVPVYMGPMNCANGWNHFEFSTPFAYDGNSNLLIVVLDNSGHYNGSAYVFAAHNTTGKSRYLQNDSSPYNITTVSGGTTSSYRNNMKLYSVVCQAVGDCAAPTPFVSRVDVDTVVVDWIPGYQETSWTLLYRAENDTSWTEEAVLTTPHYEFSTLQPMTHYYLRVIPNCGGDSIFSTIDFRTPCVAVTNFPFTENFENFTAPSTAGSPISDCWTRGTNYTSTSYPYLSTSYAYSGTKSMYFYNPSATYYNYLALPVIGDSINTLQIDFAAYKTGAAYQLMVGVMTDPDDFTTFVAVDTISPNNVSEWQIFEITFADYSGDGQYIALASAGAISYMYVDDIEVDHIPSCPRPLELSATNITTAQATLHWQHPSASYYEIEYGPAGFTRGTGTQLTSIDDSTTLYGLHHSSRYECYVRAVCTEDDTSAWSFPFYFFTSCGVIDSLPYTQNFSGWGSGTNARPVCWGCGGYSSYPYIQNVTDADQNIIGQILNMCSYNTNQVYASLPALDSVTYPINVTQVVFEAWTNNTTASYSHSLIVGVCSVQGDLATFTPVDTVNVTTTPTVFDIAFDSVPGAGQYITFVSTYTGASTGYNYAFLDSVAVELIPDCQRPNDLVASNLTHNSAILSWNSRSLITNSWQLEYGPAGFTLGSGTRINVNDNPHSLTGLNAATTYEFYVRNICGPNDTSEWSRACGRFITRQIPAQVPYLYDFENPDEWDNWQTCTNTHVNWYRGIAAGNGSIGTSTGTQAIYISADMGRTISTDLQTVVNASCYRDIDFGTSDSSFLISFRAGAGGTSTNAYDGLVAFIVDPDIVVEPTDANLTTPWGNVNDISNIAFVRMAGNWNTYSYIIDSISGVHRLAFYWFNQSTGTEDFIGHPAMIDDVSVQYIGCPRPSGIRATRISMASADLTWYGDENATYLVICRSANGNSIISDTVYTNHISLSGLNSGTRYSVVIRRQCSETETSQMSETYTFSTLICNDGTIDTIGTAATTSYEMPVNNYYKYSYTQSIIQADEISNQGDITAINFYYAGSAAITAKTACSIYMAHTTLDNFSSNGDFVPIDNMELVYSGSFNFANGWNRLLLRTPFSYDGVQNLVIAVDDNSGAYGSTAQTFYVDQTTGYSTTTFYSDSQNPDCSSNAALSSYTGSKMVYAMRPNIVLELCGQNSCPTPILRNPVVRNSSTTIRWRNTSSAYQIGYRRAVSTSWTSDFVTITDTFYTMRNLSPNTDYVYHVRQFCDSTGISNWVEGTFNTADVPCLPPMDLQVKSVTNTKVTLKWTPEENNNSYQLHVFNSYYDTIRTAAIASGSVSGLEAATTYYAAVRARCTGFDEPGEWSDTISFTTDVCPDATNLVASDIQGNSVVLDWTEGGRAETWEIQWGYRGFSQGDGSSIIVDHHPYTLTGLIGETPYDIYVRAICGDNFLSEHWSNCASITTLYSNISSVTDDARVRLYPNPTSSDVELTMPATKGAVMVEVIDVAGRLQLRNTLPAGTERATLATADLQQGAYFVRITGDDFNVVKRLIVR